MAATTVARRSYRSVRDVGLTKIRPITKKRKSLKVVVAKCMQKCEAAVNLVKKRSQKTFNINSNAMDYLTSTNNEYNIGKISCHSLLDDIRETRKKNENNQTVLDLSPSITPLSIETVTDLKISKNFVEVKHPNSRPSLDYNMSKQDCRRHIYSDKNKVECSAVIRLRNNPSIRMDINLEDCNGEEDTVNATTVSSKHYHLRWGETDHCSPPPSIILMDEKENEQVVSNISSAANIFDSKSSLETVVVPVNDIEELTEATSFRSKMKRNHLKSLTPSDNCAND